MVSRKKKKDDDNLPDNKWETIGTVLNNWWKAILVVLAIGIAVSGFTIKCGDKEVSKDALYKGKGVESAEVPNE